MNDAEDAAEKAVDEDRLLEGENPDSTLPEDVQHWAAVYTELVDFKEAALAVARTHAAQMSDAARAEVEATDLEVLGAEAERLKRRLAVWQSKLAETEA